MKHRYNEEALRSRIYLNEEELLCLMLGGNTGEEHPSPELETMLEEHLRAMRGQPVDYVIEQFTIEK